MHLLEAVYVYFFLLAGSAFIFALSLYRKNVGEMLSQRKSMSEVNATALLEVNGRPVHISPIVSGIVVGFLLVLVSVLSLGLISETADRTGEGVGLFFTAMTALSAMSFVTYSRGISDINRRSMAVRLTFMLVAGFGWYVFPSWITYNLTFVVIVCGIISPIGGVNYTAFMVASFMMIGYDVWGVFISGLIVKVATELDVFPPFLLLIPQDPLSLVLHGNILAGLGTGDIAWGGVAIATGRRYGILPFAAVGYAVSLAGLVLALSLGSGSLPALMVLVPVTFVFMQLGLFLKKGQKEKVTNQ